MKIQLTQQIIINNRHRYFSMLDALCLKSKNLYNYALYQIRQHYKETNKYLSYYDLNRTLSTEDQIDYRSLPYTQCAQQILMQIDKQYKSFYRAIKSVKMKGKKVRMPHYKDKEKGRNMVTYTNQCFKIKDNILTLKIGKCNKIELKTDKENVQQVRIIPRGNHIIIQIIYNKEYELKENNNRFGSIDLGLNNLATLTSNTCQSMIYDGRKLKSINHFYNKRRGQLQSKLTQNKHTSKRIQRLTNRRNNKIKDYMHKISCSIVEYMKANNLNTLFVGKNNGWKDSINISKTNNQKIVSILLYDNLEKQKKCNCDVHTIVPADMRFVYNPIRIRVQICI